MWPGVMIMFVVALVLFVSAVGGMAYSAWRRGRPWLIAIPATLAMVAIEVTSYGPLPSPIRYLAAFGIPVGIALPLVLPARADSRNSGTQLDPEEDARRNRTALALGWMAVSFSLIWTWYLLKDPSSCLGGGCG